MSEKRFTMKGSTILENGEEMTAWDCCDLLNEMSEKLGKQEKSVNLFFKYKELENENKELRKNYDDLVQWASKIAKRNVELDEKIGKLQKELQKQ